MSEYIYAGRGAHLLPASVPRPVRLGQRVELPDDAHTATLVALGFLRPAAPAPAAPEPEPEPVAEPPKPRKPK